MHTREQCFEQLLLGKPVRSGNWLDKIRVDALARAQTLRFPSARDDDWRFTDLSPLFQHNFQPVDSYASIELSDIEKFLIPASVRLVFVDGCFAPNLSDLSHSGSGITVSSLVERLEEQSAESVFGQLAPRQLDAFVALNTNFFEDGAWVHVDGETTIPIQLLYVTTRREFASAIYPRCMLVMESRSQATVIEDYVSLDGGPYFSNAVTEVVLKDDARLQHVRVQREDKSAFHIGHCSVSAVTGSIYKAISITEGARLSRYTVHVDQQGERTEIHLDGLALIGERQIADTHTRIDHAAPNSKSVQLHKCIADGSARAVFSGKIVVHEGASGTDSSQSSRNLLLSDKAHIDTQPQLEIFNDDVSCKHGATIGQIDADALFFLKSRGFTEARARNLLTYAFAAEVINKVPVPSLIETLSKSISERMNGAGA